MQTCITSPPYLGLRDYGTAQWEGGEAGCDHVNGFARRDQGRLSIDDRPGVNPSPVNTPTYYRDTCRKCGARRIDSQLGLEATPEEYIANMVAVFREVKRVLRNDGILWLNMGDSFLDKQLVGMPWRLAFALQADGWILRSDVVWHKPNPMPESVTDRPTKAHEYIFLLTKNGGKSLIWRARDTGEWSYNPDLSEMIVQRNWKFGDPDPKGNWSKGFRQGQYCNHSAFNNSDNEAVVLLEKREKADEEIPRWKGFDYFYDAEAIREPANPEHFSRYKYDFSGRKEGDIVCPGDSRGQRIQVDGKRDFDGNRNKRTVWTIATQPYAEAHFATFPEEIPKLCILAGSKPGDTVLDPFMGSGTTLKVALELGRKAIGIELNADYIEMAKQRCNVTPGLPLSLNSPFAYDNSDRDQLNSRENWLPLELENLGTV